MKSPEIFKLDIDTIRDHSLNLKTLVSKTKELNGETLQTNISQKDLSQIEEDPGLVDLNERLVRFMNNEKPFLNPELSLPELADLLETSRNQLSAVINKIHGINFYEFVNRYRVEEVKKLMRDPSNKHLKLISLAYDAGFNSKASFYRIFKQFTDKTPTEFLALPIAEQ